MPRGPSEAIVTKFLRDALAVDAVGVPELDEKARAKGLLGERQSINCWIWSSRSMAVAITTTERRLAQNRLRKSQCAVEIFPTKCGVGVHRPQSST